MSQRKIVAIDAIADPARLLQIGSHSALSPAEQARLSARTDGKCSHAASNFSRQ